MSEAALDPTIKVGAGIFQSARIALRHWLLVLVAILAMASSLLVLLRLAGLCFGNGHEAFVHVGSLASMSGQRKASVGDAITLATLLAEFIVTCATARLFYLRERLVPDQRQHRGQELRLARFVGRSALTWIIGTTPSVLLQIGFLHASWALYPDYADPAELWIANIAVRGASISVGAYLHARLILYIPCLVYQEHPDRLSAAWARTHSARWRIFFVIWIVHLAFAFIQPVLEALAPLAIDFEPLAQGLADWSSIDPSYVDSLVAPMAVYSILVPIELLWSAALSIIVYRKLIVIDDLRAGVFD